MINRGSHRATVATALILAVSACGRPEPLAPSELPPLDVSTVLAWVGETRPAGHVRYDVQWRLEQTGGSPVGGRGAVRVAGPDSLRLDLQGPFGVSGSAVVLGRDVDWAEPESLFRPFFPVVPLVWASVGTALPPASFQTVAGRNSSPRVWRYAAPRDTVVYVVDARTSFSAEMLGPDGIIGRTVVAYDSATGLIQSAVLSLPPLRSRLTLTVQRVVTDDPFSPDTWVRP